MGLFRKHTRSRLGESRRKVKLFYQQILEEMDREQQQLKGHRPANAIPEEEEATLHRNNKNVRGAFGVFDIRALAAAQPRIYEEDSARKNIDVPGSRAKSNAVRPR